uniref:SDG123 n=1 Tax=Arundo donax TaxID=35708 RepID=A0A0A9DKW0_ARUDO
MHGGRFLPTVLASSAAALGACRETKITFHLKGFFLSMSAWSSGLVH